MSFLAKRLNSVIGADFHQAQSGVMKNRFLRDIRKVLNIINYVHSTKVSTLVYFVDEEKALDKVEWNFKK